MTLEEQIKITEEENNAYINNKFACPKIIDWLSSILESLYSLRKSNKDKPDEEETYKEVGTLTKRFGLNGYIVAEIGHPVLEYKGTYYIFLKHEKLADLPVGFLKETLFPFIKFK